MGHDHQHSHSHHGHSHHHHDSVKNLKTAFFLNLFFTLIEFVGGFFVNSVAILSDAIHDLGDTFSLGISWYLENKSKQKGDRKFSFGYQRFSLLGALINGMVLIVGSIFVLQEAIPRIFTPEESNAPGMMILAVLGIVVNGAAVLRLGGAKSLNEKSVRLHLLEDVLGWIAVLIVGTVLLFWDVPILDPLLSLVIMSWVVFNVFRNLKATISVFLQGVPPEIDLEKLQKKLDAVPGVQSAHHTHVWSLDGQEHVLTVHLVLEEMDSVPAVIELKKQVRLILRDAEISHATIEMEFSEEGCYMPEDAEK